MARNLNGVTLTNPSTSLSLSPNQTFTVTCTPSYGGGGGVASHSLKCQFSNNGTSWTDIGPATTLSTTTTNPVVGRTVTTAISWSVRTSSTGTYFVRVAGDRPEDGTYDFFSGTQTISVSVAGKTLPTFRRDYYMEGSDVGFVNSDDNKIIIRSSAPTITIGDSGIERPLKGTITLTGYAPKAIGIIEIPTATLTLAAVRPVFPETVLPTEDALAFTGYAPTLGFDKEMTPGTRSLTLAETTPSRPVGLKLDSFAPTAIVAEIEIPGTRSIAFSSAPPDVESSSAAQITRLPQRRQVLISGKAPAAIISNIVNPLRQVMDLKGRNLIEGDVEYPQKRSMSFTGYAPQATLSDGQVIVIIGPVREFGTFIRNRSAITDVPVNYQIDDRTGFKIKIKDPFVQDYTGAYTRPESADKRSEQEFLRSKGDHQSGPVRPEPVGNERFVDDEYPNGVSADDL